MKTTQVIQSLLLFTLTFSSHAQTRRTIPTAPQGGNSVELKGVPQWLATHKFRQDKFTFVRIQYDGTRKISWATDYPDADLNLTAQLGAMTKLDVTRPVLALRLTDPTLTDHPFAYLAEPGSLQLSPNESRALREYLKGGGFLMVDDFWGQDEWNNLRLVMKEVFPKREPETLSIKHPIFHCVFDIKEFPQVTSIHHFVQGLTTERPDAKTQFRAILDDDGRIMVLMCHNTDLGDGWERMGVDEQYDKQVVKPKAIPMGINILFHALSQKKD